MLSNFKEANIQIGDKAFYVLTQDDVDKCKVPREIKEKRLKSDISAGATNKSNNTLLVLFFTPA